MSRPRSSLALALLSLALVACGSAPPPVAVMRAGPPPTDPAALSRAVDAFYAAEDVAGLRAAVQAAAAAGPHSAGYHGLAAELAALEDRPRDEVAHWLEALLDLQGSSARRILHRLVSVDWTLVERARVEAVLRTLAQDHPDADVQGMARWMLGHAAHLRGDFAARDAALAGLGFRPPLALVGTWENDQGKGFDLEQPPERGFKLSERYDGRLLSIGWREAYPQDPRGKVDLSRLMHPVPWQVAFAAAGIEAQAEGPYELRLSTTDPVKIWVNDVLVFDGRRLSRWLFEAVVLPITLRKGHNRILIKTGNRAGDDWLLAARITGPGGAPVTDGRLRAAPADQALAEGPPPGPIVPEAELVARRIAHLPAGSAERHRHAIDWATDLGLEVLAVEAAEALLADHPGSLIARYQHALALWDNQERGRTADLLNTLEQAFGAELPRLSASQARFWLQQKLADKARALLKATLARHPDRPGAALALADIYRGEKWHEERCALLSALDRATPGWPTLRSGLADCYKRLNRYPEAEAVYRDLLRALPNDLGALGDLQWLVMGQNAFVEAEALALRASRGWPHVPQGWIRLGETRRRAGDLEGASAAWRKLIELSPINPDGFMRVARLAMEAGDQAEAIEQWRAAQARDPENEALSHRLDHLAPEQTGPWMADVPDAAALDAAIASRDAVAAQDGADVIYLLDDEVTALGADGSAINYVTLVAHAANQAGRDRLTQMSVRAGGRHRILHAYAVNPAGQRVEASSIRGRAVRFRQLSEGSTVVLQYRIDERPDGYLAGHIARQWWFQGPNLQTERGRWVLYTAEGTPLLQERLDVEYSQRKVGDRIRHEWSARGKPPLIAEPGMPPFSEVAAHVVVSTVPDWATFWSWERELLRDAFRESPELRSLAARLMEGARTPQDKVERIHAYLMTDIRYQQDYEEHIAGVKPHAAPVVVARQYGDCKDKAVLFITLARLAGLKVHFALVRTRDAGRVHREVPMQQFNHAIVYVPPQPGLPEGRFYDPTVDALDVQVLRHDDQGTWSLVFDPAGGTHAWIEIPFQDPSVDDTFTDAALQLDATGRIRGDLEIAGRGRLGEFLRQGARNTKQLSQAMEQQVARTYPGGRLLGMELVQVRDVFQPARIQVAIETQGLVRREGGLLRFRIPTGWSPEGWFRLSERQHPLLFGTPRTMRWQIEISLPPGAKVQRLPEAGTVEGACMRFSREVSATGGVVRATQTVVMACERVDPAAYLSHRALADQMTALLEQEVVIGLPKPR